VKVIIVTSEFPVSSHSFIINKALSLARRGLDVELVASRPGHRKERGKLEYDFPKNLKVRYAAQVKNSTLWALAIIPKALLLGVCFPRETLRLVSLLRRHGLGSKLFIKQFMKLTPFIGRSADVIHFDFASNAVDMEVLFDFFVAKKVVSCRGSDVSIMPLTDGRLGESLNRVFEKADRVHCVSKEIQFRASRYGLNPSKVFINHPAIDTDFFRPEHRNGTSRRIPIIVSVGRLHWVKGYEYALQALQLLYKKPIPFRYRIIGAGPFEDAVRFAIWELGLSDVVDLLKDQPPVRVRENLQEADVFLLTSVSEGLSNSALEAMAMELPVVSTLAGGMSEAITDGLEGFLVKTRSPEMIAEKLDLLLTDPSLRVRMGKAARQRVERQFILERQSARFAEEYFKIVDSPPRKPPITSLRKS
jgi:colanic acid/amylovoran biosynthesis glycosyltransferase